MTKQCYAMVILIHMDTYQRRGWGILYDSIIEGVVFWMKSNTIHLTMMRWIT